MASCDACDDLIFRFTEELGEFININNAYMTQLQMEKDLDDISEEGFQLIKDRISQGAVLYGLFAEILQGMMTGHGEEDGMGDPQLDLFGPPKKNPPPMS